MFHSDFRFYFCNNDVMPPETATTPEQTTCLSTRAQPHEPLLVEWIAGAGWRTTTNGKAGERQRWAARLEDDDD
jgi:hypothetical protein